MSDSKKNHQVSRDTDCVGTKKSAIGERRLKFDPPINKRRRTNAVSSKSARYSPPATKFRQQQQQTPSLSEGHHNGEPKNHQFISKRTRLVTLIQIGEDWLYLASLGIIMALISFSMDTVITMFLNTKVWLSRDLSEDNQLLQYLGWSIMPVVLVTFSSGFVHLCSPTAIGSGIPEMKTILRGVVLNEYLTFRTLIAKIVGLTCTLGSGLPLGKEGPFVHMASIVATLLSKLVASFQGIYENESRTSEMLSAACAVGVAATFYAPIGGVLFSIEVTTVYFAVRNYWRGFFAACCGATVWRLLGFWIKNDESITALFKTNFRTDYPFDPVELLVFSFIGATCGLAGAAYIKFHREIVQFFRRHKKISGFLQKNRFVYPIIVTLIITTVTFPPLLGKYTASTLSTHTTIEHLFSNRTWSLGHQDLESRKILDAWTTPGTDFYTHLLLYIAMLFWTSALASTIPIPSGLFIPVLKMGAAYGRLIGELMHSTFPDGIHYGEYAHPANIVPGSYAVVGAAAFSGAVTHTISTSVILFEMTGQIVHIIPVILGVLIANAVCQSLQPSIYDSIIEIKKLPYLPPIASSNSVSHKVLVKDFMNTNLAYVWKLKCTYNDLKLLLSENLKITSFPLVESPRSMKLLGSIARPDLLKLLYLHLGRERRLQEVFRRNSDTLSPNLHLLNTISGRFVDAAGEDNTRRQSDSSANDKSPLDYGLELRLGAANSDTSSSSASESADSSASQATGDKRLAGAGAVEIIGSLQPRQDSLTRHEELELRLSGEESEHSACAVTPTAKIVNHYNRGTSMDDERLEKSAHEVAELVARPAEVVVVVEASADDEASAPARPPTGNGHNGPGRHLLPVTELRPMLSFDAGRGPAPRTPSASPSLSGRPTKSILKSSSTMASLNSVYKRNISAASFAGELTNFDNTNKPQPPATTTYGTGRLHGTNLAVFNVGSSATVDGMSSAEHTPPVRQRRKVRLPRLRVVDMTLEEQEEWEREQLGAYIDISRCQVDEAPFQLVEQTSLYRVHTLFSMLGLNHAYVTSFGRLVGIVALKDIRFALEKIMQE